MRTYNSLQRVLASLGHEEPDRVPFFLLPTLHGARELEMSIRDYFSLPDLVAAGQLRLRARYRHDCLSGFYFAPLEIEAWGGEVIYVDDGPPNSGQPPLKSLEAIHHLTPPRIEEAAGLQRSLATIRLLKQQSGDEVPILGGAISPFSLPVMQLGFDLYLDLIHEQPELFQQLMTINEEFCVQWANAQLDAGATAICYFDPVASPTILPRHLYESTGFAVAQRTLARIKGPTAIHLASGRCLGIMDLLTQTGTLALGVSAHEDLAEIKAATAGNISIIGNLNGIEMRHWSAAETEAKVREAITKAGLGGGFILADNHGEIPWQVPDEVLMAVSDAVHTYGRYPLNREEAT
jgi:uroporphyrinogen decarboxylase